MKKGREYDEFVATLRLMLKISTKDEAFLFFKCACINGDVSVCQACIDAKYNPNMCDTLYGVPLLVELSSCSNFKVNIAEFLINNGAKIKNKKCCGFKSPLAAACSCGNLELVKYFISKGCTITREGNDADLKIAIRNNHVEVAKFLLESQFASVNDDNYLDCELIKDKNFEMVELLLKFGANPNGPGFLNIAVKQKDYKMVKLLIKFRADPNKYEKLSPLHIAVMNNNTDIAKILLDNNADPNARIKDYSKVLQYGGSLVAADIALIKNNKDMFELLIKYGGNSTKRIEQMKVLNEISRNIPR